MTSEVTAAYIMMVAVAFIDGALRITNIPTFYMWKDFLGVTPGMNCLLRYVTKLPWCIKPVFAYFSDRHYIFGYRTKIYFVITGVIEALTLWLLSIKVHNIYYVTILIFVDQATISFRDCLAEGLMVVLSRKEDEKQTQGLANIEDKKANSSSQRYVSVIFILRFVGALASSYVAGLLLQVFTPHQLMGITSVLPIVSTIHAIFFFNEKRVKNTKEVAMKFKSFSIRDIFSFIEEYNLKSYIFYITLMLLWPNTINGIRYFLIDVLYFTTKDVGMIFTISSLVYIVYMFFMNTFFRTYSLRNFYISICLMMVLNIAVRQLQMTPELYSLAFLFAIVDQSINNLFYDLPSIPLLAIVCRNCPNSKEATYYAFFVSLSNFFCSLANFTGYIVLDLMGVTAANYTNVTAVNVVCLIWSFLCWNLSYYVMYPDTMKIKGPRETARKAEKVYVEPESEVFDYSEPISSKHEESDK